MESPVALIDDMLAILEADIPANPASPKAAKLEKRTAETVAAYFRALGRAFPYHELASIYFKHVQESRPLILTEQGIPWDDLDAIIDKVLALFRIRLTTDMIGRHVSTYLIGSTELISWGKTKGGMTIVYEGPPMKQAIDYATKHCAQLVTAMDEESKRLIAQVVSDAIENKRGVEGLARDIRAQFEDMSRTRARMIARTESSDALSQGSFDTMHAMGVNGKEWVRGSSEDCEICQGNEDDGVLPIDEPFSSGHMRTPGHPNCICAIVPVMLSRE